MLSFIKSYMSWSSQSKTQANTTMNQFSQVISILALLSSAAGQDNPCWYNALCKYDEADKLSIDTATYPTLEEQMGYCQTECVALDGDVDGVCNHFTVHASRGVPSCYLLDTCLDSSIETCLELGTCNSGPMNCDAAFNPSCPLLDDTTMISEGQISWQCDETNPYAQQVPNGATCFLTCNAWADAAGTPVYVSSTCTDGAYEPSVVSDPLLVIPALAGVALPKPDDLAAAQLACTCAAQPMSWDLNGDGTSMIAYDPNTLIGTDFICEVDPISGASPNIAFSLDPTNTCRLFCDSYHIATMACENGKWTGEPELGAW